MAIENNSENSDQKYIKAAELLEELKYFESYREEFGDIIEKDDNYEHFDNEKNTPNRDALEYKVIEEITAKELSLYMIYLMAIRNKKVKEIIERIEIVFRLVQNIQDIYQLFINKPNQIDDLESFCFTAIEFEFSKYLDENQKITRDKYITATKLPLEDFKNNLNILLKDNGVKDEFKFENLCNIVYDYCKILSERYCIYPDGISHSFGLEGLVVSKEDFNMHVHLDDKKTNDILINFLKIRNATPKSIADLFFIYDYYTYKIQIKEEGERISNNIKLALTKYHPIGIRNRKDKKIKKTILYEELRDSYIENQDEQLEYYFTERSIKDKIKMMKEFIDDCGYKYLFFV
ncbi:hypothetical protein N5T78_08990 [Aliarcobacter cryaerophilus]|uniref:hypothetical protein n=1 Tax=Aliarcobacter cryaerophilus TaxID=28198 RepID=UPI0021B6E404|nr:hypothetical protein [Aliarcobacter cryaerophilus]MCT7466713.1 hypothetical protein [Aliarcobacter cryaerophilus]